MGSLGSFIKRIFLGQAPTHESEKGDNNHLVSERVPSMGDGQDISRETVRSERFPNASSVRLDRFPGKIRILEGAEISFALEGSPKELANTVLQDSDGTVNFIGPEHARGNCVISSTVVSGGVRQVNGQISVSGDFEGTVNGVSYVNGVPIGSNSIDEPPAPPLAALITVPQGTSITIGSVQELFCTTPLGDVLFEKTGRSTVKLAEAQTVSGAIANFSIVTIGQITGLPEIAVESNAKLTIEEVHAATCHVVVNVDGSAHVSLRKGIIASAEVNVFNHARFATDDMFIEGSLTILASNATGVQHIGTVGGKLIISTHDHDQVVLTGAMRGEAEITATTFSRVTLNGEIRKNVRASALDHCAVKTFGRVGGDYLATADQFSRIEHTGGVVGALQREARDHSDIKVS